MERLAREPMVTGLFNAEFPDMELLTYDPDTKVLTIIGGEIRIGVELGAVLGDLSFIKSMYKAAGFPYTPDGKLRMERVNIVACPALMDNFIVENE